MQINFYTTAGCHLCEQAMTLLQHAANNGMPLDICLVEIADSEWLMEQYGVRIPVVTRVDTASELGWPFSYEELLYFLHQSE